MTREAFIKELDKEKYSYEIQGDKIVVTIKGYVWLKSLTSIPPGVKFNNRGAVYLSALTSLPPGVKFNNRGAVDLDALKSLPPGVEFKNKGDVWLNSLKSLPPGVVFKNGGYVYLNSIIGGEFDDWEGNIEGIAPNRLLNSMISKGIFER
jgi:hypothetical protein